MLLFFLLLLLIPAICTSCRNRRETADIDPDPGHLISFHYIYGSFRYNNFKYSLQRKPGKQGAESLFFQAEGYSNGHFAVEAELDEAVLAELVHIMTEENIFAWDGFEKYNMEVRDGFSFELRAIFAKKSVRARGYMHEPANFRAGHRRLAAYLLELAQNLRKELP